jgi:hypothetical protein
MLVMNDKLQRGLRQLAAAGHDKDKLGMSLILLHGALEEFFRSQLAAEITVDENEQGRRRTDWPDLLNLWQKHRTLSHHDRELIYAKNGKRNAVAHGDPFEISRNEMEIYAQFVRRFMGIPTSAYDESTNPSQSFQPRPTAVANPPILPTKNRSCLRQLVVTTAILGLLIGGCYWSGLSFLSSLAPESGAVEADALPEETIERVVEPTAENDVKPTQEVDDFSETESKITPPGATLPSSTKENEVAGPRIRIVGNSYVRSEPGTDSEVIGTVLDAQEYEIIETSADGNWYKIELATGQAGWLGSTRATQVSP